MWSDKRRRMGGGWKGGRGGIRGKESDVGGAGEGWAEGWEEG